MFKLEKNREKRDRKKKKEKSKKQRKIENELRVFPTVFPYLLFFLCCIREVLQMFLLIQFFILMDW
jgi:hypothetical protein